MDWRAKVELFEQIRREYEFGVGTIVGVAKKLGVHRRMVREAIGNALPKPRKRAERRRWKMNAAAAFVDAILEGDRRAPRKQRHTAHRIWERIQHELPDCKIGERTVRQYVHERKIALGMKARETFVPQIYAWGAEAQVDWYEAHADVGGERVKLQVFAMRSMASGAAFHYAYRHATQQAFLEAHERAFVYFGGVFRKLRYDNLGAAVKKILRGHRREETARFIAFRSHWHFEAEFCTPAQAHEKGGVEGEAGYFRRNHWVPVPAAEDLAALNQQLLKACQHDEHRTIAGREQNVGASLLVERDHLLPLVEGFDLAQASFPTVNGFGCVKVLTNAYSVPLPAGVQVQAKVYAATVELWHEGRCIARHERCYRRQQQILEAAGHSAPAHRHPLLRNANAATRQRAASAGPPRRHNTDSPMLLRWPTATSLDLASEPDPVTRSSAACHSVCRAAPSALARSGQSSAATNRPGASAPAASIRPVHPASDAAHRDSVPVPEKKSHVGYLEALLAAELEERERNTIERRIREAHLPRMKTLDEFDFTQSPNVTAAKMRDLSEGGYIERAEPVLFIGECGTGKTHLLTGLCVAACRQKRRVRFTTAAGLVNELVEAKHQLQLRRVLARWSRYDLIAIDEVGYVPLAEVGAEFLFQVVAERAEKAAVILTTNLPFSESTQVIPNARLCKALLDRITDRAHILETGTESYRFRRTAEKQKKGAKAN